MSEYIRFPPNLTWDEQMDFLRAELIKRNIDPDSVYPISIGDVEDAESGPLNLSVTMQYDNYLPSDTKTGFAPQRDYGDETQYPEDNQIEYFKESTDRPVREVLEEWARAVTTNRT